MKIAVLIDKLTGYGGAEKVALILAGIFNADVWTTSYYTDTADPEFKNFKVYAHPLQSLKLAVNFKFLNFFWQGLIQAEVCSRFRKMDLSGYDLIISANMCAKQVVHNPRNHPCLHYEHGVKNSYKMEWLFKPWTSYMKRMDKKATGKVDVIVCNSENIRNKIKSYYHRDAEVIYPPIDISQFKYGEPGDYFFSIQRISPDKQIETQIEAFRLTPERKLIIAGPVAKSDEPYLHKLMRTAPPNVTYRGTVTDKELAALYSHARAVIQSNSDEDFGIVPVEAMASGKPCLAINSGGFKETIVQGKTGILVDPPYIENLAKAIKGFDSKTYNPLDCQAQARKFSKESFTEKIKSIADKIKGKQ